MKRSVTWKKTLALICVGGLVVQLGSCAATLAPTALSLAEQMLLSGLLGGLGG